MILPLFCGSIGFFGEIKHTYDLYDCCVLEYLVWATTPWQQYKLYNPQHDISTWKISNQVILSALDLPDYIIISKHSVASSRSMFDISAIPRHYLLSAVSIMQILFSNYSDDTVAVTISLS